MAIDTILLVLIIILLWISIILSFRLLFYIKKHKTSLLEELTIGGYQFSYLPFFLKVNIWGYLFSKNKHDDSFLILNKRIIIFIVALIIILVTIRFILRIFPYFR